MKDKWYEHCPEGVVETDKVKILWDVNIQCNHFIEARKPDIVVVNKGERKCIIINIVVPGDNRASDKEKEKMEKYQDLKREIKRNWNVKVK